MQFLCTKRHANSEMEAALSVLVVISLIFNGAIDGKLRGLTISTAGIAAAVEVRGQGGRVYWRTHIPDASRLSRAQSCTKRCYSCKALGMSLMRST